MTLRISYIIVCLAGILLVLLPVGAIAFPWVTGWRWGVAALWWLAVIFGIGVLERRRE